uniref:Odorant receptor n=1 Tax=Bradysia odoriphaga TaxID=1564500 RepID=A0A6B9C9Q5_9DIPT|nr:odorant receptor 16 [Bradysia odoriphaga]
MNWIQIHKNIASLIFGLHRRNKPSYRDRRMKLFYFVYFALFFLSLGIGAVTNDRIEQSIFLANISIGVAVLAIKLWLLIWNQNKIINLLDRVYHFSIRNEDDQIRFNDRLGRFMKFVFGFIIAIIVTDFFGIIVLPFVGSEKTFFFEIAFPLDYKNNEIAFWIAFVFLFIGICLTAFIIIFTTIIWFLLFVCSLRYEVLESELKNMGRMGEKRVAEITEKQQHNMFVEHLKTAINAHLLLRKLVDELESFFSPLFLAQFGASGLCICGSVYCLAFDVGNNLLERLLFLFLIFYFIAELFMITYFGNEIMLSSNRLSYSLFQSDWYNQSQPIKKSIIIFDEYLQQPQMLVSGKLYPLNLETFTRILKSAYSQLVQHFEKFSVSDMKNNVLAVFRHFRHITRKKKTKTRYHLPHGKVVDYFRYIFFKIFYVKINFRMGQVNHNTLNAYFIFEQLISVTVSR